MDAIVAERLTSSPRIFNIYGFCGLSIMSQFFQHGDVEGLILGNSNGYSDKLLKDESGDLKPKNGFTPIQKVVLALEMAKGLADLHGYENGLIIHDDVQNSQFLFNDDKSMVVLNDFNRAEFPLWDEEHQDYCRYRNGPGHGNVSCFVFVGSIGGNRVLALFRFRIESLTILVLSLVPVSLLD